MMWKTLLPVVGCSTTLTELTVRYSMSRACVATMRGRSVSSMFARWDASLRMISVRVVNELAVFSQTFSA
jgi:hypothetical protein